MTGMRASQVGGKVIFLATSRISIDWRVPSSIWMMRASLGYGSVLQQARNASRVEVTG